MCRTCFLRSGSTSDACGTTPRACPCLRHAPKEYFTLGHVPVILFSGLALCAMLVVFITLAISTLVRSFEPLASACVIISVSAVPLRLASTRFQPVPAFAATIGWLRHLPVWLPWLFRVSYCFDLLELSPHVSGCIGPLPCMMLRDLKCPWGHKHDVYDCRVWSHVWQELCWHENRVLRVLWCNSTEMLKSRKPMLSDCCFDLTSVFRRNDLVGLE